MGPSRCVTLGPAEAVEQLSAAVAVGANDGILIEAPSHPGAFAPEDIAQVIGDVIRDRAEPGQTFDLVLIGNDAADTGDFQVGIRLAYDLEYPVLTRIQTITSGGDRAAAGIGVRSRHAGSDRRGRRSSPWTYLPSLPSTKAASTRAIPRSPGG